MKKAFFLLLATLLVYCSEEETTPADYFLCTVDYVEFVDDTNAIVKFDTTLGEVTSSYYGKYTYTVENNNYYIGDDLVSILNFDANGNNATFVFEYGENLGFFCATLFESLPPHVHYTFDAEAERTITGKGVGKWKIKKRTNLR